MDERKLKALKTICGAIHYTVLRYNQKEITGRDWEYLCSYLEIDQRTIHGIEVFGSGFLFWSKAISFRYWHSQFHQQRKIEIQNLSVVSPVRIDSRMQPQ